MSPSQPTVGRVPIFKGFAAIFPEGLNEKGRSAKRYRPSFIDPVPVRGRHIDQLLKLIFITYPVRILAAVQILAVLIIDPKEFACSGLILGNEEYLALCSKAYGLDGAGETA